MLFTAIMRLIVSSKADTASENILKRLLGYGWDITGEWKGNPLYSRGEDRIATVNEHHIYADDIDVELSDILGPIDHMVFISKHSSKANIHSLTVHPIGNFGTAKFGGMNGQLVPPAPHEMTGALRRLQKKTDLAGLLGEYEVSFEATHHGPFLRTPTYYIEIGSDEACWSDERAGKVIASTLMADRPKDIDHEPVAVCVGGGHYAPKFTDIARRKSISIGHIVPSWAFEDLDEENFDCALRQSEAELLIITDDVPKWLCEKLRGWCSVREIEMVTVTELD